MATFDDRFSTQAQSYARHRLTYPAELFEYVASIAPSHDMVWDCATGSGQAAHGLRAHFEHVIATDASSQQIEHAEPGEGIEYRVATAECSGLPDHSVAAVTVATAFHWFDHLAFADEVRRVGRPGGVVAVWTYGNSEMNPAVREAMRELIVPQIDPYWSAAVRAVWDGYQTFEFPFDELDPPPFEIRRMWTVDDFIAYANTWSAVQSFRDAHGYGPFEAHVEALREAWGAEAALIRWPLDMRVGRI